MQLGCMSRQHSELELELTTMQRWPHAGLKRIEELKNESKREENGRGKKETRDASCSGVPSAMVEPPVSWIGPRAEANVSLFPRLEAGATKLQGSATPLNL